MASTALVREKERADSALQRLSNLRKESKSASKTGTVMQIATSATGGAASGAVDYYAGENADTVGPATALVAAGAGVALVFANAPGGKFVADLASGMLAYQAGKAVNAKLKAKADK